MQRAARPPRPPLAVHGQNIYAYCHVRTNQVLYSLTRVLDSKQSLKQLPDLGANATPTSIRKDLWKPLFTLTLPPDPTPRTPDGKILADSEKANNLLEHAQGIDAFRRLREYRTLHELYWTPPEELSYNYTEADVEEVEEKLKKRGGSKKETAHDIIKREKKKMRRKAVMNQKANSVADLAEVLRNQEAAGLVVENMQIKAWRTARAEQVRTMVKDTKNPEGARQRAHNRAEELRERLHSLKEEEGKRTKEGEAKRAQARWKLAQAVKVKKRIEMSIKNVEEAKLRATQSREFMRQLRNEHDSEDAEGLQGTVVANEEKATISDMGTRMYAQLVQKARPDVLEFVDTVESMLLSGVQLTDPEQNISEFRSQEPDEEGPLQQLEKQVHETEKAKQPEVGLDHNLPINFERLEEVAQIWEELELNLSKHNSGVAQLRKKVDELLKLLQPLVEERDAMVPQQEALEQEQEIPRLEKEQAEHKEADFDARWEAHDALRNALQERIDSLETELADVRNELYEVILGRRKKQVLSHLLSSRGLDPLRRDFGVVGDPLTMSRAFTGLDLSNPQRKDTETDPRASTTSHDGDSLVNPKRIHSTILKADPSLPAWHALLPDLKPLPKTVRGMRKHDKDRSKVRILNAPIFKLDGIRVQWADIMDANYAGSWPESIVHEQLGWSRGTARRVEDEPQLEPELPGPKIKSPLKIWEEERDTELKTRVEMLTAKIVGQLRHPPTARARWVSKRRASSRTEQANREEERREVI